MSTAIMMATPSIHPSSGWSMMPTMREMMAARMRMMRTGSSKDWIHSFQNPVKGGSGKRLG